MMLEARKTARETCELNRLGEPVAAFDSFIGASCWMCAETAFSAVVVYFDDADSVVSTSNFPGRYERLLAQ
jgi:hypothetical protein